LGAVAGGVSFLAAYPMSPATSVMTNLAQWAAQTGVIVEQAEDEIAAINMVAGASYAGARAMTATSGGGFALMTEGISLLGMIEAPAVIVLAQRPGPATGLPTRSAQGDLHLALHAGHGHVPRVIFAPEDIADCLHLTAIALDIAERFQTPVLILTDQLLMDSQTALPPFDVDDLPTERHFLSATQLDELADYHRFAVTADGVSPLAAPGASRHVVVASSDEHDEAGHIADSVEIATRMAQKRLDKERTIATQVQLPLTLSADPAGRQLVLSWGSAKHTVAEALSLIDNGRFAHLNLRQLWPFPAAELTALMERATGVIVVENNVTGELARLVRAETLRAADTVVTKLNGRPLTVQELVRRLRGEV